MKKKNHYYVFNWILYSKTTSSFSFGSTSAAGLLPLSTFRSASHIQRPFLLSIDQTDIFFEHDIFDEQAESDSLSIERLLPPPPAHIQKYI